MKKIVKQIIAIFLLILMIPCLAMAKATDRRGTIEFCELYMYRLADYINDKNLDIDIPISTGWTPFVLDEKILLLTSVGNLEAYKGDFTVSSVQMLVDNLNADDSENERNAYVCIAAISALEFDYYEDAKFELYSKVNGSSASAMEEAIRIWCNDFDITSDTCKKAYETGEKVKVYSGNYDYYLIYYSGSDNEKTYKYYYLRAEEHE